MGEKKTFSELSTNFLESYGKRTPAKNHHYLPEYYIKGFFTTDRKIWIFDKLHNRIIPKPLSPKSIFYEENRNTINWFNVKDDIWEHVLNISESRCGKLFHHLNLNNEDTIYSKNEILQIINEFILLKLFSLPNYREFLPEYRSLILKRKLPFKVKEFLHYFESAHYIKQEEKLKQIDLILPLLDSMTLDQDDYENDLHWMIERSNFDPAFIISDSPFITQYKPSSFIEVNRNVLFPLSKNILFWQNTNYLNKKINEHLIKTINFILILQSHRYFGSSDKTFLMEAVQCYNQLKKHKITYINKFKSELFNNT